MSDDFMRVLGNCSILHVCTYIHTPYTLNRNEIEATNLNVLYRLS